jgi:hypothetical protein
MSPRTNIIIICIVGLIAAFGIGYYYVFNTEQLSIYSRAIVLDRSGLDSFRQQNIDLTKLESENIRLFSPEPPFEFKIGSNIEVAGEARSSGTKISAELTYRDKTIIETKTTAIKSKKAGGFGSFSFTFTVPEPVDDKKMKLVVYLSAPDGSQKEEVHFPIIISK